MINIRTENAEDISQVRALNERAFGQELEANLVDKLREHCPDFLSLVAEAGKSIVGHILFTPAMIEDGERRLQGMGLAPMAVLPDHQRQGIGSRLVRAGLEILRNRGCLFVVVLGHFDYYPRFGFERASRYNLRSPWDGVPDEAFMIVVFDSDLVRNAGGGVIRYRDEFNEAL